ncbi:hypothetical protein MMC34_008404 [Xylographa carneopallida]|nr:hypothetical protein [Xylographa carneopallida]
MPNAAVHARSGYRRGADLGSGMKMQLKVLSVLYGVLINPYWGDRLGTAGVIELVVDNVRRHAFKMDFAIIGCAVVVAAGMDRNCQAVERFVAAGCIDCIVATITRYLEQDKYLRGHRMSTAAHGLWFMFELFAHS